jgi:hypothetical protein
VRARVCVCVSNGVQVIGSHFIGNAAEGSTRTPYELL